MAGGRGIIRCGTFSKTLATGLRVGYIVAQPEIARRLVFARFDNGGPPILHRTIHQYLTHNDHDAHVARLQAIYRERRDASAEALRAACEPYLTFRTPSGGFFHWLKLAPGLDATAVARAASLHGVAVTPGTGYYAHGGGEDHIRLVFSALPPETLRQAVAAFAEGVAEVAQTRR